MEFVDGITIYWFISIGLMVGWVTGIVIGKEGKSAYANLFWGVISSIIMGMIGASAGLGDGLLFSFVGTLAFLFLVNVFHQHHQEDLHIDPDAAHIAKR
ncbi:MAG: hypothetical protein WD035_07240 [Balneolaceae bacterium]